ncbi:MAG TPA: hypothetical protein VL287_15920 [Gemmatimonadales bacterium]|nr:hypothetical protein [Gemmatimonadales bacterium]
MTGVLPFFLLVLVLSVPLWVLGAITTALVYRESGTPGVRALLARARPAGDRGDHRVHSRHRHPRVWFPVPGTHAGMIRSY